MQLTLLVYAAIVVVVVYPGFVAKSRRSKSMAVVVNRQMELEIAEGDRKSFITNKPDAYRCILLGSRPPALFLMSIFNIAHIPESPNRPPN